MPRNVIYLVALAGALLATGTGRAQEVEPAGEAAPPPTPRQIEDPREVLERYPPLQARPRIPVLEDNGFYPCTDCHDNEYQITNPRVRALEDMHDEIELDHGGGRFWCLTCHHPEERDSLTSLKGQTISYDEAFLLCGQCHFQRQRDFFHGAHGKRLGSWDGERTVASCPECHNPHRPVIDPAEPYQPPQVRRGLVRPEEERHRRAKPWEEAREKRGTEPPEDEAAKAEPHP